MSRILVSVAALFLLLGVLSACDPDGGSNTLAISSFEANPGTITAAGQAVTLSWDVNGPATSLDIDMGVGAVSGTSVVVNPTATTSYTLTASNSSDSVTAMTTVTVGNGGGDGEAPKGTFGVALTSSGPFQSDEGGGIT